MSAPSRHRKNKTIELGAGRDLSMCFWCLVVCAVVYKCFWCG
jgi:hypothetical protein